MSNRPSGAPSRRSRILLAVGLSLALLALAAPALFERAMPWHPVMPEALAALESGSGVDVYQTEEGWWAFMPDGSRPGGGMTLQGDALSSDGAGLILYPGARVDPRAYAPAARALADAAYPVIIVPMPLGLAVLAPNRAEAVMRAFPDVGDWAVGGHSLGGAMAASFAARHPDAVDGLLLWAAWPPDDSLADSGMVVQSLVGSEDGLATPEEILDYRDRLPPPPEGVIHTIEGGNHAQFGWYGPQAGDGEARIDRAAQQAEIDRLGLAFMQRVLTDSRARRP